MGQLYTIGYSGFGIEDFLRTLSDNRVDVVCDVRSVPYSRFRPDYSRSELKAHLNAKSIKYAFFGSELGARPKDAPVYVNGRAEYRLIAQQPFFQYGLSRVRQGVREHNLALLCAERDPIECHRAILVCRNLPDLREQILHIHGDEKLESQDHLERRLVGSLGLAPPPLLSQEQDWDLAKVKAMEIQSNRIAFVDVASTAGVEN